MQLFLEGRYTDSMEQFETEIHRVPEDAHSARWQLRCNLIACLYELGLYRRCISSCESVLANGCELGKARVYVLLSKSYYKLQRDSNGYASARTGLQHAMLLDDVYVVQELQQLLEQHNQSATPTPNEGVAVTKSVPVIVEKAEDKSKRRFLEVRDKFIGSGAKQISERVALSAVREMAHASGNDQIDLLTIAGNAQMNFGNVSDAEEIFSAILQYREDTLAAHLGLGSVLAVTFKFEAALIHFNRVISLDPTVGDAWKRRGQTKAAMGLLNDALSDYMKASSLTVSDPDLYFQIGVLHYRLINYNISLRYISKAIDLGEESAVIYNSLGMALAQLGRGEDAIAAYDKAILRDPDYIDGIYNCGVVMKEMGSASDAAAKFKLCNRLNPDYPHAYYSLGTLYYATGQYKLAVEPLRKHISLTHKTDSSSMLLLALCYQSIGEFSLALVQFDLVISDHPNLGAARTQREVLLYYIRNFKSSFKNISIDQVVHPIMKSAWSKKISWTDAASEVDDDAPAPQGSPGLFDEEKEALARDGEWKDMDKRIYHLCSASDMFGHLLQLDTPGFLGNPRQYRMFGLAVLQMASGLYTNCDSNDFGWRSFFEYSVRWRQLSDPNDAVWWIDGYPKATFEEGFGLETPIVKGQLQVIRYYTYYQPAFKSIQKLLLGERAHLSCFSAAGVPLDLKDLASLISSAETLADIWQAVGKDFYVITPYRSTLYPNRVYEGTRITLLQSHPDGFNFSIRTPGTPERWAQFSEELNALFSSVKHLISNCKHGELSELKKNEICREALKMFYMWVVFAPLSRGSAACGYACLHGILAAAGLKASRGLPHKVQLDWEAILSPSMDEFVDDAIVSWLSDSLLTIPRQADHTFHIECSSNDLGSSGTTITLDDIFNFFDAKDLRTMFRVLFKD